LEFLLESEESIDVSLQESLSAAIVLEGDSDQNFGEGDILESHLLLENQGEESQMLTFLDTCRAEMWVLNDKGTIVFDSRLIKTCNAIELDYSLDSNEQTQFSLPDWTFTDLSGCSVESGTYSIIVEVPQYHLATMETIHFSQVSSTSCASSLDVDVSAEMIENEANGFDLSINLIPRTESVDLRWTGPCAVTVSIIDISISEEVHTQASVCNIYDGRNFILPANSDSEPFSFEIGQVQMIDYDQQPLKDGDYQLVVQLEINPQTKAGFMFSWPFDEQVSTTPQSSQPVIEETPRLLSGTWSGLQTDLGTCWMFESPQDGQLLLSSAKLGLWQPSQGLSGTYSVINAPSHPACDAYQAPSFQIISIEVEQQLDAQQSDEIDESSVELAASEERVESVIPTVLVVITSGSVLSLLVTMVLGNESLRIPSTAAGLWLFGLMGRTHETSDGRYQRGRLMGYLTANPGCHFRALMAALDMSNGQITHHLRILEAEEGIWRRKDGRLVRYYPLTNALHPELADDDLPVPPLSPDPNSLQGKILSLLDQDGPLGEFPTQAELALRLEKSQQLVSHHLRTLQKFGLVEKRKMGLKNRYKLTREAIFLLETNTDFNRED
jgi:DNA-binding transcriptional ArsR family regulator